MDDGDDRRRRQAAHAPHPPVCLQDMPRLLSDGSIRLPSDLSLPERTPAITDHTVPHTASARIGLPAAGSAVRML